ncbi:MAG: hypothetical protein JRI59_10750 [Deltaproteobacteria bacterium]|nr:hypothetical protein [Deltaproteobacteria bacterium]
MAEKMVRCDKFQPRQLELGGALHALHQGPCRYHMGGELCSHPRMFICQTRGYAAWPWRADSDEDGEG